MSKRAAKVQVGDKFNMLEVVAEHTEKLRKETAWVCACDCGETTLATTSQLIHGTKKSCGCLRKRTPANALDLTDQQFGKLTVIERIGTNKNGSALWLCECQCGNKVPASATLLRRGNIVSCGCLLPSHMTKARETLTGEYTIDGVVVPLLTKKVRSDSETGHKGVHKRVRKGRERYEVSITVKGKRKYIGSFVNLDDAVAAREKAEEEYFGPYIKKLEEQHEHRRD